MAASQPQTVGGATSALAEGFLKDCAELGLRNVGAPAAGPPAPTPAPGPGIIAGSASLNGCRGVLAAERRRAFGASLAAIRRCVDGYYGVGDAGSGPAAPAGSAPAGLSKLLVAYADRKAIAEKVRLPRPFLVRESAKDERFEISPAPPRFWQSCATSHPTW